MASELDEEIMKALGLHKVAPLPERPHILILDASPPPSNRDSEAMRELLKSHQPPLIVFRDGDL